MSCRCVLTLSFVSLVAVPPGWAEPYAPDVALGKAAAKSEDMALFTENRRYNPKMWAAAHDFTGIARKVPAPLHRSAVALANTDPKRDWIATAAHTVAGRQPPLTFVDAKGRKYTIGVEAHKPKIVRKGWVKIPGTDIAVAECGELPPGIRKYPVPARQTEEEFGTLRERCVILTASNGDRVGLAQFFTDRTGTPERVAFGKHPDYPNHYLLGRMGDSGSPWFMLDPGGQLVVVSTYTTPNLGSYFGADVVQDWIEAQGLPLTRVKLVP